MSRKILPGILTFIIVNFFVFIYTGCSEHAVVVNGDKKDSEPVEYYQGLIGHGYDVINSSFYQSSDVKLLVLDIDKMLADKLIFSDNNNHRSTETSYIVGGTISSYMNKFALHSGISAKGLFSGSLQLDFGFTKSSKVEADKSFAKSSTVLIKKKDFVGSYRLTDMQNKYLSEIFKDEWLMNSAKSPEEIFRNYGTHIMLTVYYGGRLDMSYIYNNIKRENEIEIETQLKANFAFVSGSTSASTQKKNEFQSSINNETIRSYGGRLDADMTTFENTRVNYTKWAASIEDTNNLTLIKAGRIDSSTEMLPIWELIDPAWSGGQVRRDAIKEEFNNLLDEYGSILNGLQANNYIKDIFTATGNNQATTTANVRARSSESMFVIQRDMNYFSGDNKYRGNRVYIGFTLTTDTNEAITNLAVFHGSNPPANLIINGVTYFYESNKHSNLNSGSTNASGNNVNPSYLYYTKDPLAGSPIKKLAIEVDGNFDNENGQMDRTLPEEGWSRVNRNTNPNNNGFNLNTGTNSSAIVYLWMQR